MAAGKENSEYSGQKSQIEDKGTCFNCMIFLFNEKENWRISW